MVALLKLGLKLTEERRDTLAGGDAMATKNME